ncbi:unnamed protein product [Diatraea saccharalis]|uniref:unspecific monooxygenase n=1 Tax=Diatraea saccharalis TaxID=40085 RepID=A0A9N9R5R5_9NEOP|nr:unnamed protein product [Diatraea saccharalis]
MLLYVFLALSVAWLYLKWSRVRRYWARRGVPHEDPYPVLGSLTFLQKINVATWMRQMYDRYSKEPYFGIWLFWRPALVINSPEIARRILVKDFDAFKNRLVGTNTGKGDPIGGQNIFTLNDPLWSSVRRRLSPVFTSSKLKLLHHIFASKSKELVQRIKNDLNNNKDIELRHLYADYTTDVIGTSSFGIQCDTLLKGDSPLRSVTRVFERFSFLRGVAWCSIFFFPETANTFGFTFFPNSSVQYFRDIYKQMVSQRGGYNSKAEDKDLLDALRQIKYEADKNNEDMKEDLLIAQAAIFLQAGFHTSAAALTFLSNELAYKPEIQEKLFNELLQAKQAFGDKDLDASVFSELVYFNCVIKETLRKYPPMGWLDRIADKDYKIDDNLTIAKGTTVYVNAMGMHHDPEYYPDPDKFDPDRFLPENDDGTRPYMPFGDGPRICIGLRFARRTIWYGAAAVLMNYKIVPVSGTRTPARCHVDHRGLLLSPGEETNIIFVPRV